MVDMTIVDKLFYDECVIENVTELYEIIDYMNKLITPSSEYESPKHFYRGQSNFEWGLIPSVGRASICEYKEFENENVSISNYIYTISQYQHYGKVTRLLDFTTNVDVALFFACNSNLTKDGAIFIRTYSPRKLSWRDATIILELIKLNKEITLDEFAKMIISKHKGITHDLYNPSDHRSFAAYIGAWIDKGALFLPDESEYKKIEKNNIRMVRQRGCFYIFGNKMTEKCNDTLHVKYVKILPELNEQPSYGSFMYNSKIRIPANIKSDILKELDNRGINRSYLMPDVTDEI